MDLVEKRILLHNFCHTVYILGCCGFSSATSGSAATYSSAICTTAACYPTAWPVTEYADDDTVHTASTLHPRYRYVLT